MIEDLDEEVDAQLRAAAALDADQMDVRLFHLDDRAAGARQFDSSSRMASLMSRTQLFLLRVVSLPTDVPISSGVIVPNLTGRAVIPCATFHSVRVLQRPAFDLVDAARHHAALHHLEDDVALARCRRTPS